MPFKKKIRTIAGADISFNKYSPTVYAAFVVLDAVTMHVIAESSAIVDVTFPYIPGLLSFREIPPLLEAWRKLSVEPDVLVCDGQGIAHPRGLGIASHMGLVVDKPTIGCAKSVLVGKFEDLDIEAGSTAPMMYKEKQVGVALRTKTKVNPVFVSPGNLMDFESAVQIMMSCVRGYRIPEPTRQAHLLVNRIRQEAMASSGESSSGSLSGEQQPSFFVSSTGHFIHDEILI